MPNKRKVAVLIVDRANYGRLKPVMAALQEEPSIQMQVICSGTMVLERFGQPKKIVEQDGFQIDSEIFIELEGSTPTTMAKSLGFSILEFSSEFQRLKPDMLLVIGDRYEALGAAIAASYMNICIAHIQGGEVSGSIDESARHCITKLAHYHFPATERSAEYIIRMGEQSETVFGVGCPSGDIALTLDSSLSRDFFQANGIGAKIDVTNPYLLVVYHPVTTEYGKGKAEALELLEVLSELKIQTVWLWPNIDAGADHISKAIRAFRENNNTEDWLRLVKNFSPDDYLRVLANAKCAVGNSSSFIRDSSFLGTPVVLIGNRQQGREVAANVQFSSPEKKEIATTISKQLAHGKYEKSQLYGKGDASKQIAALIGKVRIYTQKRLSYAFEERTSPDVSSR